MRGLVVTLGLFSGCADIFDLVAVGSPDGGTDPECPFGRFGRNGINGAGLFDVCLTEQPQETVTAGGTIDTQMTEQCTFLSPPDDPPRAVCVIVAVDIEVRSVTRVIGNVPLVLVATNAINVSGELDVSSRRGAGSGAGSNHATCVLPLGGEDGSVTVAGAGGAGGSYKSLGGNGGNGDGGMTSGWMAAQDTIEVSYVRGGCRGGIGGFGELPTGGSGGVGGGALYLVAGTSIALASTAVLDASGQGGQGGDAGPTGTGGGGGGGGGGSGGLLGLDAPSIMLAAGARLIANGGGGGAGASGSQDGGAGASAMRTPYPFVANGGSPGIPGGYGADDERDAMSGNPGGSNDAGAGGGGGLGFIKVYTSAPIADAGALSSPAYD